MLMDMHFIVGCVVNLMLKKKKEKKIDVELIAL